MGSPQIMFDSNDDSPEDSIGCCASPCGRPVLPLELALSCILYLLARLGFGLLARDGIVLESYWGLRRHRNSGTTVPVCTTIEINNLFLYYLVGFLIAGHTF